MTNAEFKLFLELQIKALEKISAVIDRMVERNEQLIASKSDRYER